jgi:ATPase subunit of ABC transporter with duplicated ATPase domains
LDLESITAVNNGLTKFPGTILFASHDRQFIETIATRVIELTPQGCVDDGLTYAEYLKKMM